MQFCSRLSSVVCLSVLAACSKGNSEPLTQPGALSFREPVALTKDKATRGHVLVADGNADGWLDVMTWGDETQQLNLTDPVERGILQAREVTGLPAIDVKRVYWLDLNDDKAADLIILDDAGKVRRFDNKIKEDKRATTYEEVPLTWSHEGQFDTFTLVDVDRDGKLDFVGYGRSGSTAYVELHRGNDKEFTLAKRFVFPGLDGDGSAVVYPSDLDNDGVWEFLIGAHGLGWGILFDDGKLEPLSVENVESQPMNADAAAATARDAGAERDAGDSDSGVSDGADAATVEDGPGLIGLGMRFERLTTSKEFQGSFSVLDANADGRLDVLRFAPNQRVEVLWGKDDGSFDVAALGGPKLGDANQASVGCVEDFDNDARLDLLTLGKTLTLALGKKTNGEFEAPVTLGDDSATRGIACVDLDGDGDVDILTSGSYGTKLYINGLEPLQHRDAAFFGVRFRGKRGNSQALGTRVTVTSGGQMPVREFVFSAGGVSRPVPALHFGLGTQTKLDRIRITWPDGEVRTDKDWETDVVGTIIAP